jgi:Flp pilus assembly protein TadB
VRLLGATASALAVFLVIDTVTGGPGDDGAGLRLRLAGRRRHRRPPLALWLRQAGVGVTPAQFGVVSAGIGIVVWGAISTVTHSVWVGIVPAIAAGLWPRAYFGRRRQLRMAELANAWPDGIRHLVTITQARGTMHQAVLELVRSGPAPLARAFASYPVLARIGGPVEALRSIREQLADPTTDQVIERLIVAHEKGQALTLTILRDLGASLAMDLQAEAEIDSQGLEPRITSQVTFIAPWLGLVMLCLGDTGFSAFYRTAAGAVVIVAGGILSVAGLALVRWLAREPEELRVLGAGAEVAR